MAETFTSAAVALSSGRDITIGWLMIVARRRLADYWRTAERHQRTLAEARASVTTHVPEPLIEDETADLVQGLPERQRAALVLRYGFDLSVGDVAKQLGVGYSTAESLLGRGRQNLRQQIGSDRKIAGARV